MGVRVGMRHRLARRATPWTVPFPRARLASGAPSLVELLDALLRPGAYTLEMERIPTALGSLYVLVIEVQGRRTRPRRLFRPDGVEADRAVGKGRGAQGMCECRGEVVAGRLSGSTGRLGLLAWSSLRLRFWRRFCERRFEFFSSRWAGWIGWHCLRVGGLFGSRGTVMWSRRRAVCERVSLGTWTLCARRGPDVGMTRSSARRSRLSSSPTTLVMSWTTFLPLWGIVWPWLIWHGSTVKMSDNTTDAGHRFYHVSH